MTRPYESSALDYYRAGWAPLPVPGKWPPPSGWTGNDGAWPSTADVLAWIESDGEKNVALRLPPSVIGIDVDNYGGKPGALTFATALARWGQLPATWHSTSRDDGLSGIYLYRVPEGLSWPGELPGGGVEIIRHGHRYCVAPPSLHPEGRTYRWVDHDGITTTADDDLGVPFVDDLADLPAAWIDGLTSGKLAVDQARADLTDAQAQAWLDQHGAGTLCPLMLAAVKRGVMDMAGGGSRHEALTRVTARLMHLVQQGHTGGLASVAMVERAFGHTTSGEKRSGEIDRALTGAVRLAAADGDVLPPCTTDPFRCMPGRPAASSHSPSAIGPSVSTERDRIAASDATDSPARQNETVSGRVVTTTPAGPVTSTPGPAVKFQPPPPVQHFDVFGSPGPVPIVNRYEEAEPIGYDDTAPVQDYAQDASNDALSDDPAYAAHLAIEVVQQRARREARQILDDEEHARAFRVPPHTSTLSDELAIPDDPVTYRIDKILPTGGNVLLTAMYKAGKTSLLNQLARCLADGDPFLGQLAVEQLKPGERAALWNYEVDRGQYRRWLREVGVRNTSAISVLNLRGYRLPITVPHVENWIVRWLQEHGVRVWFVDPFARAFTGVSENDNTEVGRWLDAIDVIKERAGVRELILPAHTGRAEVEEGRERARGATRLDDWADVRWLLNKSDDDQRFFAATGRDVDYEEKLLKWDDKARSHQIVGGNRAITRQLAVVNAIIAVVLNDPGVTYNGILRGVKATYGRANKDVVRDQVTALVEGGRLRTEKAGQAERHYLAESAAPRDVFGS